MANVGRPRALDEFKRREIAALLAAGSGIADAARYVGCSARTIRREALRNEDFHDTLRKAELSSQLEPLRTLRKAASSNWRAAAWLLERINPDRFAKHDARSIRIDELDSIVGQLVEMIAGEIEDPNTRVRVYRRLLAATHEITKESHDLDRPRRDPKRAQRMLAGN
ncbi:MAG: helix-turn-helix domain-containing protein [Planctomycetes bacterium]|nr:helix-turn-helix domain-containing protein [Planctomycetota bacterium]